MTEINASSTKSNKNNIKSEQKRKILSQTATANKGSYNKTKKKKLPKFKITHAQISNNSKVKNFI